MGGVGFSDDEATRGVFVEAMDNTGALDSTDTRELAVAVVEEGVDEGAVVVTGGRMDDHAVSFVKDDDVFVLEKDIERDVLGRSDIWDGLGNDYSYSIAIFHAITWFSWLVINEDILLSNERLNPRSGKIRYFRCEPCVEAFLVG